MKGKFQAEFYRIGGSGRAPAMEFIDALPENEKVAIWAIITRLEEHGRLPMPYTEHLEGKIWQIRVKKGRRLIRVTYSIAGKEILLLHGFLKKTDKTPRKEIEIAQRYLEDYLS